MWGVPEDVVGEIGEATPHCFVGPGGASPAVAGFARPGGEKGRLLITCREAGMARFKADFLKELCIAGPSAHLTGLKAR